MIINLEFLIIVYNFKRNMINSQDINGIFERTKFLSKKAYNLYSRLSKYLNIRPKSEIINISYKNTSPLELHYCFSINEYVVINISHGNVYVEYIDLDVGSIMEIVTDINDILEYEKLFKRYTCMYDSISDKSEFRCSFDYNLKDSSFVAFEQEDKQIDVYYTFMIKIVTCNKYDNSIHS